jgi:hypothetical protein
MSVRAERHESVVRSVVLERCLECCRGIASLTGEGLPATCMSQSQQQPTLRPRGLTFAPDSKAS